MEALKKSVREKIHQREINISTFKTDDKEIIVEGSLLDNRLVATYHLSGVDRPPDTVHHLIIRILVDKKLVIRQVETEMPRTPHVECPETIDSLQDLVGMKISRGFTMKIKNMFGKGRGCSHLSELIISMAPAAIQGYWTAISGDPISEDLKYTMKLLLTDTCWVWRRDGPAINQLGE